MNSDESTPASLRMKAMNLLAMREHSEKELHIKLTRKCDQADLICATVKKLQDEGLQSDKRFAEAYINMCLRQGKGAHIIRLKLREKGVNDELISECLIRSVQNPDWDQLALKAYQKKYGDKPIVDLKEKSKRIRFLTARGFSTTNIQYVFKALLLNID